MNPLVLCIAQGFYIGRLPLAPGTFGTFLGFVWVVALLATGNAWLFALGTLVGIACSVWICGRAEEILGQTDPSSVVFDEIVAIPVCFATWLRIWTARHGEFPGLQILREKEAWIWMAGIFVAFRFFDILKPWPVRQSQALRGGWGVTFDDFLAAIYVNLTLLAAWSIRVWL